MIAAVILVIVLPFVGVPKSRFYPPASVYGSATGRTRGAVTGKQDKQTNDVFHIGLREYYVTYEFITPTNKQHYTGTVRVQQSAFQGIAIGQGVPVKYETTAPDINGIDLPQVGLSVAGASSIFSGWLLWIAAAFILAYVMMLIIEHFGKKEDI